MVDILILGLWWKIALNRQEDSVELGLWTVLPYVTAILLVSFQIKIAIVYLKVLGTTASDAEHQPQCILN